MTNRQERRGRRARPLERGTEGRQRNAGRRLLVVLAAIAIVVLSFAGFTVVGTATPTPSPAPSASASTAP